MADENDNRNPEQPLPTAAPDIDVTEDVPVDAPIPEGGDPGAVISGGPDFSGILDKVGGAAKGVIEDREWWEWPDVLSPFSPVVAGGWRDLVTDAWGQATTGARPELGDPDPAYAPIEAKEAGVVSDQTTDRTVLKNLYFDAISEESAFVKLINWLAGTGTITINQGIGGLGQSLKDTLEGVDGVEIYDLNSPAGKDYVRNYLMANWVKVDGLKELVSANLKTGYGDYMDALGRDGKVPSNYRNIDTDVIDPATITSILQEFGDTSFGMVAPDLGRVGDIYGTGGMDQKPIADIAFGAVEAAVDQMMETTIAPGQTLLVGPEGLPDPEGMESIGFITTFDGTPFGDVDSFNDLFSGGKIGPLTLIDQLNRADPDVVEKFQREFVALGLMNEPVSWGRLSIDPRTKTKPTIEAAVGWQVSVAQEALTMVRNNQSLTDDGTPYVDAVMDSYIARRMSGDETIATHDRELRARTVADAGNRIQQYLTNTGRYLPEGAQLQLQSGLQDMLKSMSDEDQEAAFGQGGSLWERSLAENLLKQFYGADDWGSMLTFGGSNRDQDFFNYAARVGAVSNRERDLLRVGAIDRTRYRRHWKFREDELVEAEKDVAVAGLLRFIGEGMDGSLSNATSEDVVRGLNTYMHTIGVQQRSERNLSQRDLSQFAQIALDNATGGGDELVSNLAQQGVAQYGAGVGGYRYKNLVSALNQVSRGAGKLEARNV